MNDANTTFDAGQKVKVIGHGTFTVTTGRQVREMHNGTIEDYGLTGRRGGPAMLAKRSDGQFRFMRFGSNRPRMDFVEVRAV